MTLPLAPLRIRIDNGPDLMAANVVLHRSVRVRKVLGAQVDTASFSLKSPESWRGAALTAPTVGAQVTIEVQMQIPSAVTLFDWDDVPAWDDPTRYWDAGPTTTLGWKTLFAGQVSRFQEVRIAHKTVRWDIECTDFTAYLGRILVKNETYINQRAHDIVYDIISKYGPGIDLQNSFIYGRDGTISPGATPPPLIKHVTFSYVYPAEVVQQLADLSDCTWYVDANKRVQFRKIGTKAPDAVWLVSGLTDVSHNFDSLTIEPQSDQVRNRVYVIGGEHLSDWTIDRVDPVSDAPNESIYYLKHKNIVANLTMPVTMNDVTLGTINPATGQAYTVADMIKWNNAVLEGARPFMVVFSGAQVDPAKFDSAHEYSQLVVTDAVSQSNYTTGWLLHETDGVVVPMGLQKPPSGPSDTIPTQGDSIIFQYRWKAPVFVAREDRRSMMTMAASEGVTYSGAVLADAPVFFWRLNETGGNSALNYPGLGTQFSGSIAGPTLVERELPGPIQADDYASAASANRAYWFKGARVQTYSGARLAWDQGTVEAWVRPAYGENPAEGGIVSNWDGVGLEGGLSLRFDYASGYYKFYWQDTVARIQYVAGTAASGVGVGVGNWDHVVAAWDHNHEGTTRAMWLYVNGQLTEHLAVPFGSLQVHGQPASGVEIGNFNYHYAAGVANKFYGGIANVACYDHVLSGSQVAMHYYAGAQAGVREVVINDNTLSSMDQATQIAEAELARWANPLTKVSFGSFVGGWEVGDSIPFDLTSSGIGRALDGTGLIQEVDISAVGGQLLRYNVSCESSRLNWVDYQKMISRRKDLVLGEAAISNLVRVFSDADTLYVTSGGASYLPQYIKEGKEPPPLWVALSSYSGRVGYYWQTLSGVPEEYRVAVAGRASRDGDYSFHAFVNDRSANGLPIRTYALIASGTGETHTGIILATAGEPTALTKTPVQTLSIQFLLNSGMWPVWTAPPFTP